MAELRALDDEALLALRARLDGALRGEAMMGVAPSPARVQELRDVEAEVKRRDLTPAPAAEDDPFGVRERLR